MTTATGPTAPATDRRPPGFAAALRSEWYKFWALPSNRTILVVAVALTLGITLLMAVFGDTAAMAREQEDGRYSVIFFGSTLGVWVLAALAANVVASEHRNGTVALTLAATPRRGRTLAAKLAIVAALALGCGLVVSLANFALTQAALAAAGEATVRLSDPGMLRAVLLYIPVSAFSQALLAACAAVVLRSAPGAFGLVVLLSTLPVVGARFFGPWWSENVPRHMVGAASESVAGMAVPGTEGFLPTLPALLVIAVWTAVSVAVASAAFSRRDA
ncbi:hypothetical protein ACIRPH_05540 [Nocardiopsis sp. NPDC101807]|uniref:hypothetical protein n=1 Tax=Nocardiopsis sp. NPDC101807 TaxID=3364339 RepID=UPI003827D828